MKRAVRVAALFLAVAFLVLTVVNASWLADAPRGKPKFIAHRGLYQLYDKAGVERDTCTADRIYPPYHRYLENTVESIVRTQNMGGLMVEIDIAPTRDGELVVFHDWTLDCRTDGKGPVREATLEQLKALDIGYGYTADGGKTYPFRGRFVGAMPTFEEVVQAIPDFGRLMVNFKSKDPREADLVARKLKALGRDPAQEGDGFYGHPGPVERIRELYPDAWAWSQDEARKCSEDYVKFGWSGSLPASCRGRTMLVPLNYQWAFWGWPNRLIARMEEYGGEVIVVGPIGDNLPRGLTLPEQLGEIPNSFNAHIWIEDAWTILPARFPSLDARTDAEKDAASAALERRRGGQ